MALRLCFGRFPLESSLLYRRASFPLIASRTGGCHGCVPAATLHSTSRRLLSLTTDDNSKGPPRSSTTSNGTVYVHPLSQIVLLYLQSECHDWIVSKQLDRNLTLHRDGTFVLETTTTIPSDMAASESENTTTSDDKIEESSSSGDSSMTPKVDAAVSIPTTATTTTTPTNAALRLWTCYDPVDKKHWLSMAAGPVQHRFLLQDNLMPAWQGHRKQSLPERIHQSIDELIEAVAESSK